MATGGIERRGEILTCQSIRRWEVRKRRTAELDIGLPCLVAGCARGTRVFFLQSYLYYWRRKTYTDAYRYGHGQLFLPSCTKALEENRNYIEEPRPCASPSRQKPPPPAAVEQLQAAIVEEETMVVADLEAPHRM
jgi:hypothetical protein